MKLMTARQVRAVVGSISDMTLWRWAHDEHLGFPKPILIQGRRYWRDVEINSWLNERARASFAREVL